MRERDRLLICIYIFSYVFDPERTTTKDIFTHFNITLRIFIPKELQQQKYLTVGYLSALRIVSFDGG